MCELLPMNQLLACYHCNLSREMWGLLHGNDTLFWLLDSFSFSHIQQYKMREAFQSSCKAHSHKCLIVLIFGENSFNWIKCGIL